MFSSVLTGLEFQYESEKILLITPSNTFIEDVHYMTFTHFLPTISAIGLGVYDDNWAETGRTIVKNVTNLYLDANGAPSSITNNNGLVVVISSSTSDRWAIYVNNVTLANDRVVDERNVWIQISDTQEFTIKNLKMINHTVESISIFINNYREIPLQLHNITFENWTVINAGLLHVEAPVMNVTGLKFIDVLVRDQRTSDLIGLYYYSASLSDIQLYSVTR